MKLTDKTNNGLIAVKSLTVTENTKILDYLYMGENNVPYLRVSLENETEIMIFETELSKTTNFENVKNNVKNK